MMRWFVFITVTILVGGMGGASNVQIAMAAEKVPTNDVSSHRALLDQYCVGCHNQGVLSGGLSLEAEVIDLGRGWETQYCHLKRGSLRVTDGQAVAVGDALGLINTRDPPARSPDPFELSKLEEVACYSFFHEPASCYCFPAFFRPVFFLGTRGFQWGEGVWASSKAASTFLTSPGCAAARSLRSPMSEVTS